MKTIVIGRHAKSDWSQNLPDFDRPLNKRGKADAPRMGKLLAQYNFQPDLIVSSSANRAQTTASFIARELGYSEKIQLDRGIYDNGPGYVLSVIQELPDDKNTVMLFGHNPTQEGAVRNLLDMRAGIIMPTCALVCIDLPVSSWKYIQPGQGQLRWFLIPRMIPATFP